MAYNNVIALAEQYAPILDGIYKAASKTSILDSANSNIRFVGGNKVELFETDMDGLGDYSRNAGFPTGSVTAGWVPYELTQDRGRSFMIDAMDNEETLGQAFGTLSGEFLRTKVVPEIDAYRFAKYASASNILSANADITVGTTDVPGLIDTAESAMSDLEVPEEGRILFVSEKAYAGLKAKITRMVMNGDNNINSEVLMYEDMRVVRVPSNRFNTAINLLDGTSSGETDGGYTVPASTSYAINFMIVHPSAVRQLAKHAVPRVFSPEVNQKADAWQFDYRIYHDAFVLGNKTNGIYLHRAATANS